MTSPPPGPRAWTGRSAVRGVALLAILAVAFTAIAAAAPFGSGGVTATRTAAAVRAGQDALAWNPSVATAVDAGAAPRLAAAPAWFNVTSAQPGATPPAAQSASSAFDAADNVTVLFGGCQDVVCPSNETWLFASGRWVNATNPRDAPPARYEASMDYDPNMHGVLLFGGWDSSGVRNDTWLYSAGRWTNLSWVGAAPPARRGASMAFDPEPEENGSVLFGGLLATDLTSNDTWVWEGWSGWVRLTTSVAPPPIDFAGMAYDAYDGYMVLFGGVEPCGFLCFDIFNQTWELYAGEWWPVHPAGGVPPARVESVMTYDPALSGILLFGGINGTLELVNDTWTYAAGAWHALNYAHAPSARSGAALSPDSGSVAPIVFGGADLNANLNSTWVFETPPSVGISLAAGPREVSVPVTVNLTVAGGTAPYHALVDLGDGSEAYVAGAGPTLSVTHTYAIAGSYALSASLTDDAGVDSSGSAPAVTIAAAPAVAVQASAGGVDAGNSIRLAAVALSPGTPPLSFAWRLGDGSTAIGANVTHTYSAPGTYTATVNATDGAGAWTSASVAVVVAPLPSVSAAASPGSANASGPVQLFANVTGGTTPFVYTWRFGDGNTSGFPDPVHAFAQPGTYTVNVWVNDSGGGSAHATVTVSVAAPTTIAGGAPGWFWPAILALAALGVVGVAAILLRGRKPRSRAPPAS